jgi:hypothetical protein
MAGTFPFVLAYQIMAAPIVAALLLLAGGVFMIIASPGFLRDGNAIVLGGILLVVITAAGVLFALSVAGFYEGWRVGWAYGSGRTLREVLSEAPMYRRLQRWSARAQALMRRADKTPC